MGDGDVKSNLYSGSLESFLHSHKSMTYHYTQGCLSPEPKHLQMYNTTCPRKDSSPESTLPITYKKKKNFEV